MLRAENVLYSWIDAAAYNHTNMCVSMEEYQAHFTFSSLHATTTTCISRSRRLLDRTERTEERGGSMAEHLASTTALSQRLLLCTLQNSPHTHSHTSTKMWVAANAARVMEGLFAKILLRQAAARQHFFFISSIQWGSCQKCLLNARIHAVLGASSSSHLGMFGPF